MKIATFTSILLVLFAGASIAGGTCSRPTNDSPFPTPDSISDWREVDISSTFTPTPTSRQYTSLLWNTESSHWRKTPENQPVGYEVEGLPNGQIRLRLYYSDHPRTISNIQNILDRSQFRSASPSYGFFSYTLHSYLVRGAHYHSPLTFYQISLSPEQAYDFVHLLGNLRVLGGQNFPFPVIDFHRLAQLATASATVTGAVVEPNATSSGQILTPSSLGYAGVRSSSSPPPSPR